MPLERGAASTDLERDSIRFRQDPILFLWALRSSAASVSEGTEMCTRRQGAFRSAVRSVGFHCESPQREVVRSSAGAGVVYPPFWGSFA